MNITTIKASVRFSRPQPDGSFKTIELGAEASLTSSEDWHKAQSELYGQLVGQLKSLWGGKSEAKDSDAAEASKPQDSHYCSGHGVAFKRYEKNGRVWYAHENGGEWCREAVTH